VRQGLPDQRQGLQVQVRPAQLLVRQGLQVQVRPAQLLVRQGLQVQPLLP
jgi:hypothetical protein